MRAFCVEMDTFALRAGRLPAGLNDVLVRAECATLLWKTSGPRLR